MITVALIRHAPTVWNLEGRIQGREDTPLADIGRDMARRWRLPQALRHLVWMTSTLARTRETAALMGLAVEAAEPRLDEMDWAGWSGRTLAALRAEFGEDMAANEALGLDFRPPGGESPREVQDRLRAWLGDCVAGGRDTGAVTHRGVLRAAVSLATGWPLLGPPPVALGRASVLVLEVGADGSVALGATGLSLEPS